MSPAATMGILDDILLVLLVFALGYVSAPGPAAPIVKLQYRFVPRNATEALDTPPDALREYEAMFNGSTRAPHPSRTDST